MHTLRHMAILFGDYVKAISAILSQKAAKCAPEDG